MRYPLLYSVAVPPPAADTCRQTDGESLQPIRLPCASIQSACFSAFRQYLSQNHWPLPPHDVHSGNSPSSPQSGFQPPVSVATCNRNPSHGTHKYSGHRRPQLSPASPHCGASTLLPAHALPRPCPAPHQSPAPSCQSGWAPLPPVQSSPQPSPPHSSLPPSYQSSPANQNNRHERF